MSRALWVAGPIPGETVRTVRSAADRLVAEIVAAVEQESTVYAAVFDGPEGMALRMGIEQAMRTFLDAIERGERPGGEAAETWQRLGEAEFQAGRELEPLREAFRTGTRAAWRSAAQIAAEAGLPAATVIALAEALFVYSDELTADVLEGYRRIQSDEAGERARHRRRLVALLLDSAAHDPETVEREAERARWRLPRRLAAVAVEADSPDQLAHWVPGTLPGTDGEGSFLLVADPSGPGRIAELRAAVGESSAALGPPVPVRTAAASLRWARAALGLARAGALPASGLVVVDEHLGTVLALQDRELGRELARRRLGPLLALPDGERERLLETLHAWLAHQRHTPGIAAELHVHPQTVRYRLARLRELLGDALESADGRFELELALRAVPLLSGPG